MGSSKDGMAGAIGGADRGAGDDSTGQGLLAVSGQQGQAWHRATTMQQWGLAI